MVELKQKYINPFTDYGFKRLFGEEPSKDLLIDFLNELLKGREDKIVELSFQPQESLPMTIGNRKAIFDIFCTDENGAQFIVEMQKAEQQYFKDRMLFYSTFPIQAQAKDKGKHWDFKLKHVYAVGILDFAFKEDDSSPEQYRYDVMLTEQNTDALFYDKLTFTYLSMEKFNKTLDELETKFEKWLYVIKNLSKLDRVPEALKEEVFTKFFKIAEISQLKQEEYKEYESSLNDYRDIKNSIDWAHTTGVRKGREEGLEKGIERGREEEKILAAKTGLEEGYPIGMISKMTGLTEDEVIKLKTDID